MKETNWKRVLLYIQKNEAEWMTTGINETTIEDEISKGVKLNTRELETSIIYLERQALIETGSEDKKPPYIRITGAGFSAALDIEKHQNAMKTQKALICFGALTAFTSITQLVLSNTPGFVVFVYLLIILGILYAFLRSN